MASEEEEKKALESIPFSQAEVVPTIRAITEALAYCFDRFGPAAKEDVVDTLTFKTKERGLDNHLAKHPGANREFLKQALLEVIAGLEAES